MKNIVIVILCIFIIIVIYYGYTYNDMTYVKSDIDGQFYLVQDVPDKQEASNTLARIKQNVLKLSNYLNDHKSDDKNKEYIEYIERLYKFAPDIIIAENKQDSIYTSYSVNKGQQIIFCLRSRKLRSNLHDINLMMYVVLHEISHVACPYYDNHGPLFKKIFAFITQNAIDIGIYKKIPFSESSQEYCGLIISDSII